MRAATVVVTTITTLLATACPIPPLDSPQSLIIWRTRDGIGGEEIRCAHGRIRAADPRAVGPARPGSAS